MASFFCHAFVGTKQVRLERIVRRQLAPMDDPRQVHPRPDDGSLKRPPEPYPITWNRRLLARSLRSQLSGGAASPHAASLASEDAPPTGPETSAGALPDHLKPPAVGAKPPKPTAGRSDIASRGPTRPASPPKTQPCCRGSTGA